MKKGKLAGKIIAVIAFLIILYLLFPTIQGFIEEPPATESFVMAKNFEFEFKRVITVSAVGTYTLNITLPQNNPYQKVVVIDESHLPKKVLEEANRTIWSYTLTGNHEIVIRYRGNTTTKIWKIEKSLNIDAIPEKLKKQYDHREYILDEHNQKIWVINPQPFRNMTLNITKDKGSVLDKLRAIYDVIQANLEYNSQGGGLPHDAVTTWNAGGGDCDELSFVFVSMARSIGIPAWVEYGLLYTSKSWGPHAWVATMIPTPNGLVKVNMDITSDLGGENLGRGFLIRDPYRITLWEEDGNSSHLTSYYRFIMGHYQNLKYEDTTQIIEAKEMGELHIGVESSRLPRWMMMLFITAVIIIVIFIIIKI